MYKLQGRKRYGVCFKHSMDHERLPGVETVVMERYGIPMLFASRSEAGDYMLRVYGSSRLKPYEVSEDKALAVARRIVEFFSGRRTVRDGELVETDTTRPTYDDLKEWIEKVPKTVSSGKRKRPKFVVKKRN